MRRDSANGVLQGALNLFNLFVSDLVEDLDLGQGVCNTYTRLVHTDDSVLLSSSTAQ